MHTGFQWSGYQKLEEPDTDCAYVLATLSGAPVITGTHQTFTLSITQRIMLHRSNENFIQDPHGGAYKSLTIWGLIVSTRRALESPLPILYPEIPTPLFPLVSHSHLSK